MFITRATQIHGPKYMYHKVEYVDPDTPVKIFCTIHKEFFWQRPRIHLVRGGCPMCTLVK